MLDLNFCLEEVVIDFEQAIHSNCIKVWKDLQIVGWRFHLTQSLFLQNQYLGLTIKYRDTNSVIKHYVKNFFEIQFLGHSNFTEVLTAAKAFCNLILVSMAKILFSIWKLVNVNNLKNKFLEYNHNTISTFIVPLVIIAYEVYNNLICRWM